MPPKMGRRGVLMTATARKPRAAWRELPDEDDEPDDGASDEEALAAKSSQLEWEQLAREVREEQRKRFAETEFSSGRRGDSVAVIAYDDAVSDEEESVPQRPAPSSPAAGEAAAPVRADSDRGPAQDEAGRVSAASPAAAEDGGALRSRSDAAPSAGSPAGQPEAGEAGEEEEEEEEEAERLPPEGAITAGKVQKEKKRGGKKVPGCQKRKRKEDGDEAEGDDDQPGKKKKRRDEEEGDEESKKWIKLKLEGQSKPKRIKAARIVYYYDHDSVGALFPKEAGGAGSSSASSAPAAEAGETTAAPVLGPAPSPGSAAAATAPTAPAGPQAAPPPLPGNFRSQVRLDLWADDSEDD